MKHQCLALLAVVALASGVAAQNLGRLEQLARDRLQQESGRGVSIAPQQDVRFAQPGQHGARNLSSEAVGALDRVIDRETYRLGPGDELLLGQWGEMNDSHTLVVTPEGRLLVPSVGPFDVDGLTIVEAERRIIEGSGEAYGNTRLTLDLAKLRTFRVHVTGYVAQPGAYVATMADRVSDVVARAQGATRNASLRGINVTHRGGEVVVADLVRYSLAGDLTKNQPVEMGDVINVPAREDSIGIHGAVANPGYVEYRPGDTIRDLIEMSGGVQRGAILSRTEWVLSLIHI